MEFTHVDPVDRALGRLGLGAPEPPVRVLLVDDTPLNLRVLADTLGPLGYTLLVATTGAQCLKIARRSAPSLVLLDVMMPEMDGYEVCRRMKADPALADVPVIFCSALDDAGSRVRGLEAGGVDFVTKPFDPAEIVARVKVHLAIARLTRGLEDRNRALQRELALARDARATTLDRMAEVLVGTSAPVVELRAAIESLARTSEPVLLTSDPGCGEEAVARAIHEASPRRDRPFLRVECPLLRPSDVARLFSADAERGALARVELAEGGTLFFEGLHRMPIELAAPLFAMLDEHDEAEVEGRARALDVRLVCSATTPSPGAESVEVLDRWRRRARARKTLRLPTLAERRDDLPALVELFAERHARLTGRRFDRVSESTLRDLARHWWPGNLRELEEVVRSGVLRSQRTTLEIDARLLADGVPFGSYRLLRKLSEGGMGTLWEARHQLLARPAVVKLIRGGQMPADRRVLERRFELEARATARLRSPHTVTLFDYGISEDGAFYYVMEKLEGVDLEDAIERDGPMPPARVVTLLRQACKSLAEAHASGLVHRDVKPANLFLCALGLEVDVLKVLDFGVVKWAEADDALSTAPMEAVCGTPAYMSPEAAGGAAELDGRADVYALGCVAYFMLTGRLPFEAATATGVMMAHVLTPPVPPSRRAAQPIPPELDAIVLGCLAKDKDARPTAVELDAALEATRLGDGWRAADARAWWEERLPEVLREVAPEGG